MRYDDLQRLATAADEAGLTAEWHALMSHVMRLHERCSSAVLWTKRWRHLYERTAAIPAILVNGHTRPFECHDCGEPVLFTAALPLLCDPCKDKHSGAVCYFASLHITDALPTQVRIGWTTNLAKRLSDEGALCCIRTEPGAFTRETELHSQFAPLHVAYSWYRLEGELLEYLADDLALLMAKVPA